MIRVFIPSTRRAERVLTRKVCPWATLVVPESQVDAYRATAGDPILPLPEHLDGNIAKVRNFILDQAGPTQFVMLDDDLRNMGVHQGGVMLRYTPKQLQRFLERGFRLADELRVHLWGINLQFDPRFYREYSPLSFLAPVLGPFVCHNRPPAGRRFDEDLWLKEDYDFFLRTIEADHKVLRFNSHWYQADHYTAGGCGTHRLTTEETRQLRKLERRWGSRVVSYDLSKSLNPRVRVPIPGI